MWTRCRSGKHYWSNEACAERCCDPDWRRELRFSNDFNMSDDLRTVVKCSVGAFVFTRKEDEQ